MEYLASVQIQIPTFVSCKNCNFWFPVEHAHCCNNNMDTIEHSHIINWNLM